MSCDYEAATEERHPGAGSAATSGRPLRLAALQLMVAVLDARLAQGCTAEGLFDDVVLELGDLERDLQDLLFVLLLDHEHAIVVPDDQIARLDSHIAEGDRHVCARDLDAVLARPHEA